MSEKHAKKGLNQNQSRENNKKQRLPIFRDVIIINFKL